MNSLQSIMELHGEAYVKSKKLPSNILKALYSIKDCRTAALGGHVYECDECGETKISYKIGIAQNVSLMLKKCGFMREVKNYYQLTIFILFLLYQNN